MDDFVAAGARVCSPTTASERLGRFSAAFVAVERSGTRQGHPFQRQSWFIISQVIEAQPLATMIQSKSGHDGK